MAEIIFPGSERTDRLRKVGEYARLGIPRYWIVEHTPRLAVQVLTLADGAYTAAPLVIEGTRLEAVIGGTRRLPTLSAEAANHPRPPGVRRGRHGQAGSGD